VREHIVHETVCVPQHAPADRDLCAKLFVQVLNGLGLLKGDSVQAVDDDVVAVGEPVRELDSRPAPSPLDQVGQDGLNERLVLSVDVLNAAQALEQLVGLCSPALVVECGKFGVAVALESLDHVLKVDPIEVEF
jgi:hypothetical protein